MTVQVRTVPTPEGVATFRQPGTVSSLSTSFPEPAVAPAPGSGPAVGGTATGVPVAGTQQVVPPAAGAGVPGVGAALAPAAGFPLVPGSAPLATFVDPVAQLGQLNLLAALAALDPVAAVTAQSPVLAMLNPAVNPAAALLSWNPAAAPSLALLNPALAAGPLLTGLGLSLFT